MPARRPLQKPGSNLSLILEIVGNHNLQSSPHKMRCHVWLPRRLAVPAASRSSRLSSPLSWGILTNTKERRFVHEGPKVGSRSDQRRPGCGSTDRKCKKRTEAVYPPCTWLPQFCVLQPLYRVKESITYVFSAPLLVRSPPPLPKVFVFNLLDRCRLANWNTVAD
jgi:hypothetical protein